MMPNANDGFMKGISEGSIIFYRKEKREIPFGKVGKFYSRRLQYVFLEL